MVLLVVGAGEKSSIVGLLPARKESTRVRDTQCDESVRRWSNGWEIASDELFTNVGG